MHQIHAKSTTPGLLCEHKQLRLLTCNLSHEQSSKKSNTLSQNVMSDRFIANPRIKSTIES